MSWWSRRRQRVTTTAAVVAVPALVATLALLNPGFPLARVDLNDGAVWLTATQTHKLGRYNPAVEELNAGLVTEGGDFDVLQDGSDVLLREPGAVSVVDTATVALTTSVAAPGTEVSMAAGTVAFVDEDGDVWVRGFTQLDGLRVGDDPPDATVGAGGAAVVARSGVAFAVGTDGAVTRVDVSTGVARASGDGSVGAGPVEQLTTVGDEPVVLAGSTLRTRHGTVELPGEGLVLQQPGPASSRVLVASRTALMEVPLSGGSRVDHETRGDGRPAAPVQVGACAHGAWASTTGSYARLCDGAAPVAQDLQGMTTADQLVFRVNRSVVALNDTLQGRLWLPQQDTELRVPNWDDIQPEEEPTEEPEESDTQDTTQDLVAECGESSAPPTAADDTYGVRPGRTTILPVIDNDSTSDCGILVVSQYDPLPEDFGTVEPIYGGRALQVRVQPGASGSATFTYTINDGRGTSAPSTATVTLTVRDGEGGPPEQVRTGSFKVEQQGEARYDVLADFQDPDGDDLLLVGATADPKAGTVRFRQDGQLTFRADGTDLGRTTVKVTVSDGTHETTGEVDVEVRPAGSLPPQIDPVHAVTYADQPVTLEPLGAVRSSSTEPPRLASVSDVVGGVVEADLQGGTFTFEAPRPGVYYVSFVVTVAPQQATGLARIDVLPWPDQVQPPVAVRDQAFLPAGGEVTVDPLANDSDPAGSVLVLQSVEQPAGAGLKIAVLEHRLVQISATRTLDGPVVLTYTVSNGAASAEGQIVVQPVPPSSSSQPPVVPNVEASVRTGGVVTIPVLDSAYDPDGGRVELRPNLVEGLAAGDGLMFVSGDVLRYQAPNRPLTARATFAVVDETGNETAATVTIRVHESDASTKEPPRPKDLTARVFAGETVRIAVPLVGIDPDGDGVTLLGEARSGTKGFVTAKGPDWLEYRALAGELGTDEFTYAVEDWTGQRAVATVRVGISPRPTEAATVVARDDQVTVRPNQTVEVRVLANDVDSAGDTLHLLEALTVPEGVDARVEDRRIRVVAPAQAGTFQIVYTAANDRGGSDTGVLAVTVDPQAAVLPPIARDVVVPAADTLGLTEVSVDVLAVAQNPSGPTSDLRIEIPRSVQDVARVGPDGRTVVVTLVDHAQTLPYLLYNDTEPEARSYAFISVPALGFFPPTPRRNAPQLSVASGETLEIPLDEQVQVAPGRTATVADPLAVSATKAAPGSALVKNGTTLTYTAEDGYAGPASITVPVTDAQGAGDTTARTAVITLQIEVFALEDHPPTFTPSSIDVGQGDAPITVDLRSFTQGPNGETGAERYSYQVSSAVPAGFVATISDGSLLTVSAEKTAAKGTVGQLGLRLGYGRSGSLDVVVPLRVIASKQPTARVLDRHVDDAAEGKAVSVDVLRDASNPFPSDPLRVVGAVVETPGAGTASATASSVTVTPRVGFIGQMVVRFLVRDVTNDPDRQVEGRIFLTVRGVPDAPTAPRVGEVRDRTVVLSWDAPDNRGASIDGYRVTATPGGAVHTCESTTCTIDGLSNDTEYTFTVEAHNAVGWSERSPASASARPDAVPEAPGGITFEGFGDGQLTWSWAAAASTGSPVTSYTVEITPAPPSGPSTVTETSTRHTFTGLANGTSYSIRVRAHNRAPDPSPWSASSSSQTPARAPDAPADLTAEATDTQVGNVLDISWTRVTGAAAGGDAVSKYTVTVDGPNGVTETVGADVRRFTFTKARTGVDYTVSVVAHNKAGAGATATTKAVTSGLPTAPTSLSASNVPGRGAADLTWSGAGANGSPITGYVVVVDGNESLRVQGTSTRVDGLGVGSHTFQVRAVNTNGPSAGASPSQSVSTTLPPDQVAGLRLAATVDQSTGQYTKVTAAWDAPQWNGGSDRRYAYQWIVDGDVRDSGTTTERTLELTDLPTLTQGKRSFKVEVRVQSQSSECGPGAGVPSCLDPRAASETYTRVAEPGAPTSVDIAAYHDGDTQLTASWGEPSNDGGGSVTGYRVRWTVDGTAGSWLDVTSSPARLDVSGLAAGDHDVRVEVAAVNARGEGRTASATERFTVPEPDTGTGP